MIAPPLAELLLRLNGSHVPELALAIARVAEALDEGHVCVPLDAMGIAGESLRACSIVGAPGEFKPLILDAGRLYLARYWQYERKLADMLAARFVESAPCDETALSAGLDRWLRGADAAQRAAAANAVRRRFSVITGGPGTGKTRTATIAIALLAEQGVTRFALGAPTGKAAARLKESLAQTLGTLDMDAATRARLPVDASTLHRLLGPIPGSANFRHDADNPLSAEAVIVDEASMVDLPLMSKLFAALRPDARIVLLGDPHQLASVEAGHVLGDICAGAPRECITGLEKNHRFAGTSGIFRLSRAVNGGDPAAVLSLLESPPDDLIGMPTPAPSALAGALCEPIIAGFRAAIQAAEPRAALDALGEFRILCALRGGPYGVVNLNRLAEAALDAAGFIAADGAQYAGRPVVVLRNDHRQRLYNGDLGIIRPDRAGRLRAFFPDDSTGVREFDPARLPEHETAFAMTVHKTQGSEFARVLIVLPDRDSPVLSRELIYTGVTRARERVELWWSEVPLHAALLRREMRWSGLKSKLRVSG